MKILSPEQASEFLKDRFGLSRTPRTLANLRKARKGPRFLRPSGKEVLYREEDLEAWAKELLGEPQM